MEHPYNDLTMELAISILSAGVALVLHELRWRERLANERLAAKDREATARLDGTTDGVADLMRKLRWPSNDEARAALTPR